VHGVFRAETREQILGIVQRLRDDEGAQAVILGGTELPLLFRNGADPGVPLLDTTSIHADRAVGELL
jgi:aspartate racemase